MPFFLHLFFFYTIDTCIHHSFINIFKTSIEWGSGNFFNIYFNLLALQARAADQLSFKTLIFGPITDN